MEIVANKNFHPLWAEIDVPALRHNFRLIRSHVKASSLIMAVVKGNAYGHGSIAVASMLAQEGADSFGVARLVEAEQLRQSNILKPILIFGITDPHHISSLEEGDFIQTIHSLSYAKELNRAAKAAGCRIRVHLKIDTGMGRLGVLTQRNGGIGSISSLVRQISGFDSLHLQGIFTHFATCDTKSLDGARYQLDLFCSCLSDLSANGLRHNLCIHASNSAATMVLPEAHFDMVRPGIMLYGLTPSTEMDSSAFELHPAMSIKAKVSQVKRVPQGSPIGYGHAHITKNETIIATVPVGYADGYSRLLSSKGQMLIRGNFANIVGRVCMDQLMLDVGHIPDVQEGDEVVVLGKQGANEITADDIAGLTNTINYEVVSSILSRVPRIYVE